MNNLSQRSVLIVEDDPDWRKTYIQECREQGWNVKAFNNVAGALSAIESGDVMFDIAIVDKGGSNAARGGKDIIGHRDGLTILRRLKELQPFCIRVLSTGEKWSREIFEDATLGLHAFSDKAWYAENRDALFEHLRSWQTAPTLKSPLLFTMDSAGPRGERWS